MPLTLEKLFSETVTSTLEAFGETVHLTWSPSRYTGEMDELAVKLRDDEVEDRADYAALVEAGDLAGAERLRREVERRLAASSRTFVAQLLVEWDVLDGVTPIPHDVPGLLKLPDWFVIAVFNAMSEENQTDPTNAPSSDDGSGTEISEQSPTGSPSSGGRKSSKSRRGK